MTTFIVTRPDMPWRPTKTVEAHRLVQVEGRLEFYDDVGALTEMFAVGAWESVKEA